MFNYPSIFKLALSVALAMGTLLYSPICSAVDGEFKMASLEDSRSTSNSLLQSPINREQYRVRAAQHIYKLNTEKVYTGRMPPLLKAVGVVEIQLNGTGEIRNIKWSRAPSHAPEVMQEIERTVRSAAPYPIGQKGESVVFTETWLWHKSGRFQLLSLTEGQD